MIANVLRKDLVVLEDWEDTWSLRTGTHGELLQFMFIVCLRERAKLSISSHEHTMNSSHKHEHTVNSSRREFQGTRTLWHVSARRSDAEQSRSVEHFKNYPREHTYQF